MKSAPIILSLVSMAIVVASLCLDVQDKSPGPIAAVHAQMPELRDPRNCALCHGYRSSAMTAACLACHLSIARQLEDGHGFHGLMKASLANDCAQCHSEHHGHDFPITNGRSFELAGVTSSERVHDGLDFRLAGKHTSLACASCHPNANEAVLKQGTTRYMGLDQNCTSCHEDVHKGTYGHDCNSCHGQQHAFAIAPDFHHTTAFELVGSHARVACVACHQKGTAHAVGVLLSANGSGAAHPAAVRTCVECHPSPHSMDFMKQVSVSLGSPWQQACQHCHPPTHAAFHGPEATFSKQLHACTGFALDPPHQNVVCADCHEGFGNPKAQRTEFQAAYPGRHADDCQACHGDPHYGQFELGPFRGQGCLACHQRQSFVCDFDLAAHNRTAFPLHAAHQSVACDKCHKDDPDPPPAPIGVKKMVAKLFHGTPKSCRACHADPHQDQFESPAFLSADCSVCHDERSFQHPTFDLAAHERTGFPLTGAHQAVGCHSCHRESTQIVNGLALERRVFHGTAQVCSACHADVHDGVFDRRGLPAVLDGRQDCARCHTTDNFSNVRAETFDHGRWTGYALLGAHAKTKCAACHTPSRADPFGRTFGRVTSRNCQSCHTDPHVGQFGPTKSVDCSQCHLEGDRFSELRFDHQTDSVFHLDETHVGLACAACHKPQQLSNGQSAIRYKPLGTRCGDCHVPQGPRR